MMTKRIQVTIKALVILVVIGGLYVVSLCFPQPFFKYSFSLRNVTIYSDEPLPKDQIRPILESAQSKIEQSDLYKKDTEHRIFIANKHWRWRYFTNSNYKVGGLNYTIFRHNIFLRKADIEDNRLYSLSGDKVTGDRTLDYFIAHEITHTLEFVSREFYKYPFKTNWLLEGYAEYVAHDSESYEEALNTYLEVPETTGAKYYTRVRTMTAYLLEKEGYEVSELWDEIDNYDEILSKAIPVNKPYFDDGLYKW